MKKILHLKELRPRWRGIRKTKKEACHVASHKTVHKKKERIQQNNKSTKAIRNP